VSVIDQSTGEIVPIARPGLLTAAPVADALALQRTFHELCTALLDRSDYQRIGATEFKKKSAWRKLAAAFNVSDTIVERNYERDNDGRIIRCEVLVLATAPNGRSTEGMGLASIYERKFSNPEHDIPATAHTRAKNRAFADLFGLGEVSAEEMTDEPRPPVVRRAPAARKSKRPEPTPPPGTVDLATVLGDMTQRQRDDFRSWRKAKGWDWPPADVDQLSAMALEVDRLLAVEAEEHDTYDGPDE
jgi:hypothetical protein